MEELCNALSKAASGYTKTSVPYRQTGYQFQVHELQKLTTETYHVLDHSGNISKFQKGDIIQAATTYPSAITNATTLKKKKNFLQGNQTHTYTHIITNYY